MENSCGLYLDTEEEKEMFFRISKLLCRLMAIFLFLYAAAFSGAAEAGVTLVPNDRGGPNPTSGDYVYLGRYPHCKGTYPPPASFSENDYEQAPTPVLWRVMSADVASSP